MAVEVKVRLRNLDIPARREREDPVADDAAPPQPLKNVLLLPGARWIGRVIGDTRSVAMCVRLPSEVDRDAQPDGAEGRVSSQRAGDEMRLR